MMKAALFALVGISVCPVIAGCAKADSTSDKAACQMDAMRDGRDWSTDRRLRFVALCMKSKGWAPSSSCVENGIEGTDACEYARQ